MTDMTEQFLRFYISNLSTLSKAFDQNKRSIQSVNEKITETTLELQQKFKQIVADMMKKPTLKKDEEVARDHGIKRMYFQIRQIHKLEAEKRALTRESCNILDEYFAALGRKVESVQSVPVNTNDGDDEVLLAETLASIKLRLDKPVEGDAVVVDVIKKMEKRDQDRTDQEAIGTLFDGDSKNITMFNTALKGALDQETKNEASDTILEIDHLQAFIDRVLGICVEMKSRYGTGETSNAQSAVSSNSDANEDVVLVDDEEYNSELCCGQALQYGEMVECDNKKCKTKWYHFECVALSKAPIGLWFCPKCSVFDDDAK